LAGSKRERRAALGGVGAPGGGGGDGLFVSVAEDIEGLHGGGVAPEEAIAPEEAVAPEETEAGGAGVAPDEAIAPENGSRPRGRRSPRRIWLPQVAAVVVLVNRELAAWVIFTQLEPPAAPQV
jgi:hypothetical protein